MRGAMVSGLIQQLLTQTNWGRATYKVEVEIGELYRQIGLPCD